MSVRRPSHNLIKAFKAQVQAKANNNTPKAPPAKPGLKGANHPENKLVDTNFDGGRNAGKGLRPTPFLIASAGVRDFSFSSRMNDTYTNKNQLEGQNAQGKSSGDINGDENRVNNGNITNNTHNVTKAKTEGKITPYDNVADRWKLLDPDKVTSERLPDAPGDLKVVKRTCKTQKENDIELYEFTPKNFNPTENKTILVIGSMHGNEPEGKLVIDSYMEQLRTQDNEEMNNRIIFIPCLNPDGFDVNKRYNGNGKEGKDIDINRDFVNQSQIETQFVLSMLEEYKPDLVIDIHTPKNYINSSSYAGNAPESINKITGLPILEGKEKEEEEGTLSLRAFSENERIPYVIVEFQNSNTGIIRDMIDPAIRDLIPREKIKEIRRDIGTYNGRAAAFEAIIKEIENSEAIKNIKKSKPHVAFEAVERGYEFMDAGKEIFNWLAFTYPNPYVDPDAN